LEILNSIIFIYAIMGLIVSGGLFFNKAHSANFYLGLFILLFCLELFDFLYITSGVAKSHPIFYMVVFPICLLFGPSLWFHFTEFDKKAKLSNQQKIYHLIPFFVYLCYTFFLLSFSGEERLRFVFENYQTHILPWYYFRAIHVTFYAFLMVWFLKNKTTDWTKKRKSYISIIIGIYFITAVLQAYLTVFAESYESFITYFLLASTIVLFTGYVLYFQPEIFQRIRKKYFRSSLTIEDKNRISDKIKNYLSLSENITNPKLNLDLLCEKIEEKKNHVSQTLSQEFEFSFNDLINKTRIQHSKSMLQNPNFDQLKILAIALESGFSNKNTFNRAFLKFENCTPSDFRKKTRVK